MSTRIVSTPSPRPVVSPAPVAKSAPVTSQVTGPASGFDAAPVASNALKGAAAAGHVPLPSLAAGQASSPNRPLPMESPKAQAAIAQSLAALNAGPNGFTASGVRYVPTQVTVDELGMTHVRFDRNVDGTKVFGSQAISHLGKDGMVQSVTGDTAEIQAPVNVRAPLSTDKAEAIARAQFEGEPRSTKSEAVLVQDANGQYVRAVHVELTNLQDGAPRDQHYLVSAATGEVMDSWNQIDPFLDPASVASARQSMDPAPTPEPTPAPEPTPTPEPTPNPKADDTSLYSGKVEIDATQKEDGTWALDDKTRGQGVETRDANNKYNNTGATEIVDDNNLWGEATDPERSKAAVDAQYGAQMTYDFYKDVLGRDSIDGKGEKLNNNVHIRDNYVNAFWDGTQMNYGDGDGVNSGPLTAIDVAGHEITHGLTERTAGLQYRGESGGLNEAMSDILGKGVEWYAAQQNPDVKPSWGVGSTIWTPGKDGDALRYMDDPSKDGRSVDNYQNYKPGLDVHYSSGIANNAFVLLVQGGTNRTSGIEVKDGIGMDKAEKIFARALTTYMTPSTTFAQARAYTLQAAQDLYGADSVEAQTVAQSWTAVGVN